MRPFWVAGLGVGVVGLEPAVFNRLVLIHTDGDPALDFINGIGLEAALRFGR